MAGEDALPVALRRRADHPLGAYPPDHPGDVAAHLEGALQPAVGMAQEGEVGDPDAGGGGGLLLAAQLRHLDAALATVRAAGVAVGDDAVRDVDPLAGPGRDRARAAEVDVVRMGGDDEDALERGGRTLGHGCAYLTTKVPYICVGWMSQWKWYVPAVSAGML